MTMNLWGGRNDATMLKPNPSPAVTMNLWGGRNQKGDVEALLDPQ